LPPLPPSATRWPQQTQREPSASGGAPPTTRSRPAPAKRKSPEHPPARGALAQVGREDRLATHDSFQRRFTMRKRLSAVTPVLLLLLSAGFPAGALAQDRERAETASQQFQLLRQKSVQAELKMTTEQIKAVQDTLDTWRQADKVVVGKVG